MRVELLCLDVDGTLTDGRLFYGFGNSSLGASFVDFGNLGRFADFHPVSHPKFPKNSTTSTAIRRICERSEAINTRICDFSQGDSSDSKNSPSLAEGVRGWVKTHSLLDSANPQNLGGNSDKNAESTPFCHSKSSSCHSERSEESKNNPSLRANPQDLRGNPPCDSALFSQGGLPRSHSLARNDEILDSSLHKCSAQNDKNSARVAESRLDSANFPTDSASSTNETNSSIVDEFSRFCEASDADRTDGSSRKRALRDCEKSPQDEFAEILKVFNAKDGLALAYWTKSLNRKVAIITGKKSEVLRHRARELGINLLFMGVSDKGAVVRGLKKDLGLDSTQIAAIGDDLNDISMFAESSLNFAPRDCAQHLKTLPNIEILRCKGGRGAVREAIEIILQKEGIYEDFISVFAR